MVAEVHANAADTALGCQRDRGARVTRGGPGDPFWPPPSPPRGTEGLATRGTGTRVAWALRPRPDAPWHRRPPSAMGARGVGTPPQNPSPRASCPKAALRPAGDLQGPPAGLKGGTNPLLGTSRVTQLNGGVLGTHGSPAEPRWVPLCRDPAAKSLALLLLARSQPWRGLGASRVYIFYDNYRDALQT